MQNSLLLRLGGMIAAISLLAVVGMLASWMVAQTTQGSGAAINLAGSLRMQSWRMLALYTQAQQPIAADLALDLPTAIAQFESDLGAKIISAVLLEHHLPYADAALSSQRIYRQIVQRWQVCIKPWLLTQQACQAAPNLPQAMMVFVNEINELVKHIENSTEAKIFVLRMILGLALVSTLFLVGWSLYLANKILVMPLRELLLMTEYIRQGNLAVRTELLGQDEIGQLGQAFNRMAEELSKLYATLEMRVEEKTAELTRSNRSLTLLYQTMNRLHGVASNQQTFLRVLQDSEAVLGLGKSALCLKNAEQALGRVVGDSALDFCQTFANCAACLSNRAVHPVEIRDDGRRFLRLPLVDAEKQYGLLLFEVPPDCQPAAWQIQLATALARHFGVTLASEQRIEQRRRVALLEERAVIARELHDSLAQSLAYMKIQLSRLRRALEPWHTQAEVQATLDELREGLNNAYQQLRELLSTFRLRIEDVDLHLALAQTVDEFSLRGQLPIELSIQPPTLILSPNEEIHLLHIVREALSNVLKHAHASHAWVKLHLHESRLHLHIEDDGSGIHQAAGAHHYGMTIMEERSRALQGSIEYLPHLSGGTCVHVSFTPHHLKSI